MVQGVLSGIGIGLTYGPSIAVISQHFSKRRTLAMSLAASGTPLGAIIHPIMLNHLLNSHIGFSKGVLVSASFVSGLLLIACLLMRMRALPVTSTNYHTVARKCFRDVPFILMTLGCVVSETRDFNDWPYLGQRYFRSGFTSLYFIYNWILWNTGLMSISRSTL